MTINFHQSKAISPRLRSERNIRPLLTLSLPLSLALCSCVSLFVASARAQPSEPKAAKRAAPVAVSGLVETATGFTQLTQADIDPRPLTSVHRARLWLRGAVETRASYMVHLAYDRVGADELALLQGKPLGDTRAPAVQDIILHLNVLPKQRLTLTTGFFRPAVGHENNTVVITLPTMEPALTSSLVRRATVDRGHGRASGFNLGSLIKLGGELSLQLHAGLFVPTYSGTRDYVSYEQSLGTQLNSLLASSLTLTWGDRSQRRNGNLLFHFNPLKSARALHFGASAAYQGATDRMREGQVFTGFVAGQWDQLLFDGEWVSAKRFHADGGLISNRAWHARLAYQINIGEHQLTPFVLHTRLDCDEVSAMDWESSLGSLNLFAGQSALWDVGANIHIVSRRLRLGLHFLHTSLGEAELTKQPLKEGMSGILTIHMHI